MTKHKFLENLHWIENMFFVRHVYQTCGTLSTSNKYTVCVWSWGSVSLSKIHK